MLNLVFNSKRITSAKYYLISAMGVILSAIGVQKVIGTNNHIERSASVFSVGFT